METKIIKKLIVSIILVFLVIPVFGQGFTKNFIDQNYIEVTGEAEKEVVPDEIYLQIIINEKDFKDKKLEDIERSMISALEDLGIDISKSLSVRDFVSNFKYYWLKKTDILMTKEYELLLHEAKTAGRVFVELEKLGISNISIEKLDHSNLEKLKEEVKIEAIKSARNKARSITTAIGQDIGKAIHIVEYEPHVGPFGSPEGKGPGFLIRGATQFSPEKEDSTPVIEFDKIELRARIEVKFEL